MDADRKELETFAYVASHDMREPLRKIQSFGAILAENLQGRLDEESAYCLEGMLSGAGRLAEMLDGLLLYSRAARSAADSAGCDLNTLLQDQLTELSLAHPEIIWKTEPLPWVPASWDQMQVLFSQLLGNACKFRSSARALEISVGFDLEQEEFFIADNGIGLPAEQAELAFSLFGRLHGRAEGFDGHGLGLAICKKIVQVLGGRIRVVSLLQAGTEIRFHIPGWVGKV